MTVLLSDIEKHLSLLKFRIEALEAHSAAVLSEQHNGSSDGMRSALQLCSAKLQNLQKRVLSLEALQEGRIGDACMLPGVEEGSSCQEKEQCLQSELNRKGVVDCKFVRVPGDYYDKDLEYRRNCIGAGSISQLCKSIVMENTRAPSDFPDCGSFAASRFYCIIIQYEARLHGGKVEKFLRDCSNGLSLKHYSIRLAPTEVSHRLTGYTHNAVTPVGMTMKLPIIMSDAIGKERFDYFWMGGGEVDLKVGMSVSDFKKAYLPAVIDCT